MLKMYVSVCVTQQSLYTDSPTHSLRPRDSQSDSNTQRHYPLHAQLTLAAGTTMLQSFTLQLPPAPLSLTRLTVVVSSTTSSIISAIDTTAMATTTFRPPSSAASPDSSIGRAQPLLLRRSRR